MNTSDVITLASLAGLTLVGLSALGGLRQALRMAERQTRRADAAREQWERARGAAGSWRARALDAENRVLGLEALRYSEESPASNSVLADRERELLKLKGPCSNTKCRLHYAHSGPCDTRELTPTESPTFVVPTDDAALTYRDGFHDGAQHRADRMAAGLPVVTPAGNGDTKATRTMRVVEGVDGFDGSDR